jgi:hypothetical protein
MVSVSFHSPGAMPSAAAARGSRHEAASKAASAAETRHDAGRRFLNHME